MEEKRKEIIMRFGALKPYIKRKAIEKMSGVNERTFANYMSGGYISEEKIKRRDKALYALEEVFMQ